MKKFTSILMILVMGTMVFSGCGKDTVDTKAPTSNEAKQNVETKSAGDNAEIVDGRFVETRKITVEVFDRGNEGGSKPEDNAYTDFIKEGMLREHNVEVTFVPVPRWTEVEQLNNLLAAGDAPDVCVTYSYPTVQTYANMGGITDLAPYLEANKESLSNLWELLTDQNIYYNQDPEKGTIWAIEARLANSNRINTFVREDWLKKLNIKEPTTLEEFESMLNAFKDNAELLLGAESKNMVPFSTSYDIGWRNDHLLASFIPSNMSDKDKYTLGFDDRRLLYPGIKEGVTKLNEWYNKGLIWKDFPLYPAGDKTEDNMMKAGYVGAFMHNWDYPYREGEDSINNSLKRMVGPDSGYVAIMPFKNDAGKYVKYLPQPVDRKIFFPKTNKEPVASLLYLDFISRPETIKFLQIGKEGVTHEVMPDGAIKIIPATGNDIMNSASNIDYTITNNGLNLGDAALNIKSIGLGYVGVEPSVIEKAFKYTTFDGVYTENYNFGEIKAEEGMGPVLTEKRDRFLTQAVVAPASNFDSVFDGGLKDYLSSGGQAIIDERTAAWEKNKK
ncbi:extracellular solute-binding protein [Cellulosilyticum sp. I15G10I2]|uniref:extracellular solute-binding protein n=1 Tax=Cellulosilyticum sp. I15G10I2 TaxID=1892843 RepID=UPI00085C3FC2|nr:extracellular solute-binding protein [Cellulosilyticum sp. I15G10I2]